MSKPKQIVLYMGSFDPITNGHLWMIQRASELFDEVVIAVGTNPDKRSMFSPEERVAMVQESIRELFNVSNVRVEVVGNEFAIHYAQHILAQYIVRGIRGQNDYEYERTMRYVNSDISPLITTIFLMPPREIAEVSSSLVKGLVGIDGWHDIVKKYVPEIVYKKFAALEQQKIERQNKLKELTE